MDRTLTMLQGKTALITGAAKRLGRAAALALGNEGVNVIVHYNTSADAANEVAVSLETAGVKAWALQADLNDAAQTESLMSQAIESAGQVDVLVNNASVFPENTILEMPISSLAENMRIHFDAPLILSRKMARQNQPGHIINFLDSRIVDYDRTHAAYHVSKRALATLTRMLALELAPKIAVNAIAPGLILPPGDQDSSYLEKLAHTNPMNAYGSPADITDAVLFLLRSRFITGQTLYIDGGRHLKGQMYE